MKTLYVHIGTKKTGTTSIQGFCVHNRKALESKGYCFPDLPFQYYRVTTEERNGHFLVGAVWAEDGSHDLNKERQIFQEGMGYIRNCFKRTTILFYQMNRFGKTPTWFALLYGKN